MLITSELLKIGGAARPPPLPSYAYDVLIANCRSPRQKNVYILYIREALNTISDNNETILFN